MRRCPRGRKRDGQYILSIFDGIAPFFGITYSSLLRRFDQSEVAKSRVKYHQCHSKGQSEIIAPIFGVNSQAPSQPVDIYGK